MSAALHYILWGTAECSTTTLLETQKSHKFICILVTFSIQLQRHISLPIFNSVFQIFTWHLFMQKMYNYL